MGRRKGRDQFEPATARGLEFPDRTFLIYLHVSLHKIKKFETLLKAKKEKKSCHNVWRFRGKMSRSPVQSIYEKDTHETHVESTRRKIGHNSRPDLSCFSHHFPAKR